VVSSGVRGASDCLAEVSHEDTKRGRRCEGQAPEVLVGAATVGCRWALLRTRSLRSTEHRGFRTTKHTNRHESGDAEGMGFLTRRHEGTKKGSVGAREVPREHWVVHLGTGFHKLLPSVSIREIRGLKTGFLNH